MSELINLEKTLGVSFNNKKLLKESLVHRSYLNEHNEFDGDHNERLEFLGDAVLEIIVTEYLFNNYPKTSEGDLTNWRASLVNAKMLYLVAIELDLEKYIFLSKGEAKDENKKSRKYILSNAIEALIGALYLDQGIEEARKFILARIISRLPGIIENKLYLDPKSRFQELTQRERGITPHYEVLSETGPDHAKQFTVGLYLNEEKISEGTGLSKQEAQVLAAKNALEIFK